MDRKEYLKQYRKTEEYRRKNAERMRKRHKTEEGKAYEAERGTTPKRRFSNAKRFNTKYRKTWDGILDLKEWTITYEQYLDIVSRPCTYCNNSLSDETGSGLDRIDNTKGYVLGNVNPCCGGCNRIRSDSMDAEEFKRQNKLNGRWKEDLIPSDKKE